MTTLQPLRLLLLAVAGWVHREQAAAIAYLQEENRVLCEQLGDRRLRLTDAQRRRLAATGGALGRRLLPRVATIVTPDTILRWHRRLIAAKWTRPTARTGRPGLMKAIRELIVALANDNPTWGYRRIQGELNKLGHNAAKSTIAKTLNEHGVPPSPERTTSWGSFLRHHADALAATDFCSAEVWTARGLVTHYLLFVIDHATRAVETRPSEHARTGPRCGHHDERRQPLHGTDGAEPDGPARRLPASQAPNDLDRTVPRLRSETRPGAWSTRPFGVG